MGASAGALTVFEAIGRLFMACVYKIRADTPKARRELDLAWDAISPLSIAENAALVLADEVRLIAVNALVPLLPTAATTGPVGVGITVCIYVITQAMVLHGRSQLRPRLFPWLKSFVYARQPKQEWAHRPMVDDANPVATAMTVFQRVPEELVCPLSLAMV